MMMIMIMIIGAALTVSVALDIIALTLHHPQQYMMASMRFAYLTSLAWLALGAEHKALSVGASGQTKSMVRKRHTSTFAGLVRTDSFSGHRGMNCSTGNGGDTIDTVKGLKLSECQKSCGNVPFVMNH